MIKFIKRGSISEGKKIAIHLLSIIMALLVSGLIILIFTGKNPISVYMAMLDGSFGSRYRFNQVIVKTIPLIITSLGIAAAFKMKFWNIGAEGQIFMGAFGASFFALNFSYLPRPILLIIMAIAGIISGGIFALIPAFFKAEWKTNETIITLMLNYVALKFVTYLQYGPWKDPSASGFPKIPNFKTSAVLPKLFGIHIGWVIAIILIIVMFIFMNKSKLGYEISVIGESENTARYAGINIKRTIITAMLISGGLCGLAGMIEASAVSNTLSVEVTGGAGYTAIITAWLAGLSAPMIGLVSFLFALLIQGAAYIQTAYNIPSSMAQMLQGIILFFVLGSEFFVQYKLITKKNLEILINKELNKEGE
ncbi:MAG: ABC transporter permease [Bacillota bacterium]|nr:ABC transporter permease [Bacillota bacterium]